MSDSEAYGSEESYEFEFEDDEVSDQGSDMNQDEDEPELQNAYYVAKSVKDEDIQIALEKLDKIASTEITEETGIWVYKSTKQMAKIYFGNHDLQLCLQTLAKLPKSVSVIEDKQYLDESLNRIFNTYGNVKDDEFRLKLYDIVLNHIESIGSRPNNDRLWIKACVNQLSILLKQRKLDQCTTLIKELNEKLERVSEITRTSYSLEVIAGEIELLSLYKDVDFNRLDYLYKKSLTIVSPVTHPRIVGVIKECGGKLQFTKGNYGESRSTFYGSFKSFDECGSDEKDRTFKYLILLSLITDNEFSPFESQETQHYALEPDFKELTLMVECFNELNLTGYKSIFNNLQPQNNEFFKDKIFIESVPIIESLIIDKILINYFKSYSVLSLEFIQQNLYLSSTELQSILLRMGSQGKLHNVKIDFIDKVIRMSGNSHKKLPPLISPEEVFVNVKCFTQHKLPSTNSAHDMVLEPNEDEHNDNEEQELMDDEVPDKPDSNYLLRKLSSSHSTPRIEQIKIIQRTLKILETSVPKPYTSGLSTKDQIFTEQRLGSSNPEILARLQNNESGSVDPEEKLTQYDLLAKQLIKNLTATELLNTSQE